MNGGLISNGLGILLVFMTSFLATAQKGDTTDVFWSKGSVIGEKNGKYEIDFGGRIMVDGAYIKPSEDFKEVYGDVSGGVEMRRVRFYNKGTLYHGSVNYKLQFDFAGGMAEVKDVFIGIPDLPVIGQLMVGHFKEPMGLEQTNSSKYMAFMERGLSDEFVPGRNTGALINNSFANKRISFTAGAYMDADDFGAAVEEGGYSITGRITGLPYRKSERLFVHLGLSGRGKFDDRNGYELDAQPEAHLLDVDPVGVKFLDVDKDMRFGTELAAVLGPFSLQGEYVQAMTKEPNFADTYTFYGYYGEITWFLTGESRAYDRGVGSFDRMSPEKNLGEDGGLGAFELALKYSLADFNSGIIQGGTMSGISGGINWYFNPSSRMMINYVFTDVEDVGSASAAQMRFQIDF